MCRLKYPLRASFLPTTREGIIPCRCHPNAGPPTSKPNGCDERKVREMAMKEKHVETKKEREEKRKEKKQEREMRHQAHQQSSA